MYYVVTGATLSGLNGSKLVFDDLPTGLNRFQAARFPTPSPGPNFSYVSYPHA